jgi:hypothetical protein
VVDIVEGHIQVFDLKRARSLALCLEKMKPVKRKGATAIIACPELI